MNIELHIDRLVLEGFALGWRERTLLQAAFESELSRLVGEGGLSASMQAGLAVPTLRAPALDATQSQSPEHLGSALARAVYGGISR